MKTAGNFKMILVSGLLYANCFGLLSCQNDKNNGETQANVENSITIDSVEYFPNSKQISRKGKLTNGKRDGIWIDYYESGDVWTKKSYVQGNLDGEWSSYMQNGQIEVKGVYVQGKFDGERYEYYEDGKIKLKASYIQGKSVGDTTFKYYPSGKIYNIERNLNNARDGECVYYYENGKIKSVENYIQGGSSGVSTYYFENGDVQRKEAYEQGLPSGDFVSYYENGKVEKEENYYNGEQKWRIEYDSTGLETSNTKIAYEQHREAMNEAFNRGQGNAKTYASDGQQCKECPGHYRGGFCGLCGAASKDRIKESDSKLAACEYCNGAKFVKVMSGTKVCPSCKGSGKQKY